jgi:hypothetical protein
MPLSAREKQAGRLFRDASQAVLNGRNRADPPGVFVLPLWRVVRHECPAAGAASIGITLREHYELSPEFRVVGRDLYPAVPGLREAVPAKVVAAAGRFAFIWKEGKCSGAECGLAVRTRTGRFVVTADRLAEHGRVRDERQARARL